MLNATCFARSMLKTQNTSSCSWLLPRRFFRVLYPCVFWKAALMGAVVLPGGSELLDTMASEQRLLRYKALYEELVKQGIYRGLICQSWPTLVRVPVELLEEAVHTKDVRPALRSMAAGVARQRPLLPHGVCSVALC